MSYSHSHECEDIYGTIQRGARSPSSPAHALLRHGSAFQSPTFNQIAITTVRGEKKTKNWEIKPWEMGQNPCVTSCRGRERIRIIAEGKFICGGESSVLSMRETFVESPVSEAALGGEAVSFCTWHLRKKTDKGSLILMEAFRAGVSMW